MIKKKIIVFLFLTCSFLYAADLVVVIEKGDTLYGLSKKYSVSVSDILKKNNITDPSKIRIGQKILIPQGDIPKKPNSSKKNAAPKSKIDINQTPETYTIKKGDSLFGLAKKFGVNFSELLNLNGFTDKTIIKIGQVINIPVGKNLQKKGEVKPEKSNPKKTPTNKKSVDKESSIRYISSKEADPNLLWPVPAKQVFYLSGKISGVVIDSKEGQAVKAITSGKVVSTGTHRGFGQVVFVQSKTKHIFVYAGLSKISVKKGNTVKVGTKLGELGPELFTGKSRLYFMVYNKNKPIDPAKAPRGF